MMSREGKLMVQDLEGGGAAGALSFRKGDGVRSRAQMEELASDRCVKSSSLVKGVNRLYW